MLLIKTFEMVMKGLIRAFYVIIIPLKFAAMVYYTKRKP